MPQLAERTEKLKAQTPEVSADSRHRSCRVLRRECEAGGVFYRSCLGFSLIAYLGPETGARDRVSYVLGQSKIRFVFTTASGVRKPTVQRGHAERADKAKFPPR